MFPTWSSADRFGWVGFAALPGRFVQAAVGQVVAVLAVSAGGSVPVAAAVAPVVMMKTSASGVAVGPRAQEPKSPIGSGEFESRWMGSIP